MKSHKDEKNTYSNKISEKIKEYLSDYLKNIDFDMSFNNSHFVFEVKEVEVRSDVLKKFGIPLELIKGKVQEIKVTIQSITFNKPILIEVQGINVEMQTIYLSRDYKKDYKNFRQKILDEWEKNHREFLQNLMKKTSFMERLMINQMIPMKIEVKNIKVVITDTVTSQVPRKIAFVIGNVTSFGCDERWEPIHQQKEEMEEVRRIFDVSKGYINIYQEKNAREEDAEVMTTENSFLQPLDFQIKILFPVKKNPNLRRIPKLHLEVSIESPILLDISISKLKFLNSFLSYLSKIKEVEKYWIHRPEIKDEKVNATMAKEWFKYAFRVVREELRNRKRQNNDFSTLIEKIINMQRYIQFYKTSHKLIIAPWIIYNDCNEDLQAIENKMSTEDIVYCREIAFTELITEGKAFCASGEIGEGYKPLVHLWEFYVNDLRSKWMNKSDQNSQIELSPDERRDLIMIANMDKDKVILSYLKGEPNHPQDIISSIKIRIDVLIINISRKVKNRYKTDKLLSNPKEDKQNKNTKEPEILEQMKFYQSIYMTIIEKSLQKTKFYEHLQDLSEDDIRGIILEQGKLEITQNDSHSDDDEKSNNMLIYGMNKNVELGHLNEGTGRTNIQRTNDPNDTNIFNEKERERESYMLNSNIVDKSYRKPGLNHLRVTTHQNLNDSDSVDYLDDQVDDNENIILNEENPGIRKETYPQLVINQVKPTNYKVSANSIRDSNIAGQRRLLNSNLNSRNSDLQFNYAKFNTILNKNEDTQYERTAISDILKKPEQYNLRKTIFSIVFGQIQVNKTLLRNEADDTDVKVYSFNIIDHNLTYTLANKCKEAHENNYFSSQDPPSENDCIRLHFKKVFCKSELSAVNTDEKFDPAEDPTRYLDAALAKFLSDIVIHQKNRDAVFMKDFIQERTFINEFIYKYGVGEIDANSEPSQVDEYYQKLVISFLLEKNVLKEKLEVIEKTIKQTKMNYLLHEKYNIFNKKFIAKVFEKGVSKSLFRNINKTATSKFNNENYYYNNTFNKSGKSKRDQSNILDEEIQKDEKIRNLMIADLNFVMQEICVNLMKYIFSSLYPYFMNEKGIQLVFKKNIKLYCDKIAEKMKEDIKKSTTMNMEVTVSESDFFLVMRMTKQGREYPHYIYRENDSVDQDKKSLKSVKTNEREKKLTNPTERTAPDKNRPPIGREINAAEERENLSCEDRHLHPNEFNKNINEVTSKSLTNKCTLNIKMNKDINIIFSNETLAELLLIFPLLALDKNEVSFAGNILSDLKKSYLEIYENLREIKAKWKVMEYLKDFKEKKDKNSNKKVNTNTFEMNYLLSKLKHMEELAKAGMSINLSISAINIEVIDKLFFITYEKNSSVTLKLNNIEIKNSKLDKLPILLSEEETDRHNLNNLSKGNKVNNEKDFDFDLILKMFTETNINVKKIFVLIDNENPLLETNLKIKLISSIIQNVPFLPDSIIDVNSSYIRVNITPSIIKASYILSNMNYYKDLYSTKYEISKNLFDLIKINKNAKENSDKDSTSSIIKHFHKKLQKNMSKLLSDKQRYKGLVSYLKNRNNLILFYSVGKYNPRHSHETKKVNYKNGIFIEFKEYDTCLPKEVLQSIKKLNQSTARNGHNETEALSHENVNESKDSFNAENNIFTLHIPILIFNLRDNLFFEEKQLWLSDVFTYKLNSDPNLNFEKLKIKFDSEEQFKFTSFEFLFCKLFLNTTDYLLYNNDENMSSLNDIQFKSPDFPFDFKFAVPSKLKLNNLYSQKSFYYEQEDTLRSKIYPKLFTKKSEFNRFNSTGEILSYFKISIEKISFQIFAKNNSQILKFIENIKSYNVIEQDLKMNKLNFEKGEKPELNPNQGYNLNTSKKRTEVSKKLSMHRIFIHIKDIKLKAFYDIENTHNNPMAFFVVSNISYQENMNIVMKSLSDGRKEILIKDDSSKIAAVILSNLFISSIKLVLSIPSFFRPEDEEEERIKILDVNKMKEIFKAMEKEKNKLIVMNMGNISAKLIHKEWSEIEFEVGEAIKLGFVEREGTKVTPSDIDSTKIEPIVWIASRKLLNKESAMSGMYNLSSNNLQIENVDLMQNISEDIKRGNMSELEIEKDDKEPQINYSVKMAIIPVQPPLKRRVTTEDESNLFYNILKSLSIVHSLTSLQSEYMLNINFNTINVELPWYLFHYVYYLNNHLLEMETKVCKADLPLFDKIEVHEDIQNKLIDTGEKELNPNEIKLLNEFSDKQNPTISFVKDATKPPKKISRGFVIKKDAIKRISKIGQFFDNKLKNNQSHGIKDSKEKKYKMVKLLMPYLSICFRQKNLNNEEVVFLTINLIDIKGDVIINFAERNKDILAIKIFNVKLKPFEGRYSNLLVKSEVNKFDLIDIEVKLNMPTSDFKNRLLKPKEPSEDQIRIIVHLRQATFVMINKTLKELILFFEVNRECLKQNPLKKHLKMLIEIIEEEETLFKLKIYEGVVVLPESSQSANLIGINFREGSILFKNSNEIPKLCLDNNKKVQIIDKNTTFNLKPILADEKEFVPHTRIELMGSDIFAYFFIDNDHEQFFTAEALNATLKLPSIDSIVFGLRKEFWKEKYKCNVVSYKPSMIIDIAKAELVSTLGKIFSLKLFVDSNIDEKSSVLQDTKAKFGNIEFSFTINSGKGRVDLFKMNEDYTKNFEHITDILPGHGNETNINPLNNYK